jgi:mono/diheme cytochrome c family protein
VKRAQKAFVAGLFVLGALAGCSQTEMADQPKYKPDQAAKEFPQDQADRPLVADTVSRKQNIKPVPSKNPLPITYALLQRGQQRFNIYCAPCHGRAGDGQGIIVQRGFPSPPSYHIPRLMHARERHFYDVITNGWGVMYSYASRVKPRDRWAIAAYIRALQLALHAPEKDVPPGIKLPGAKRRNHS